MKDCSKYIDTLASCCNCNDEHPASYSCCPGNPINKRPRYNSHTNSQTTTENTSKNINENEKSVSDNKKLNSLVAEQKSCNNQKS